MDISNYILTAKMCRENEQIRSLTPLERGVLRDVFDLMWLSNRKSALPDNYEIIAERLNINERTLKSSIKKLFNVGLLREDKTPCGNYIVSPMLERQADGQFDKIEQNIINETKQIMEITARASGVEKEVGLVKKFIDLSECLDIEKYTNWMPTHNYIKSGEAYVITSDLKTQMKEVAPNINVDFILIRAYSWLIKEENSNRRPTFANMANFLCRFAERFEKQSKNKKQSNKKAVEMTQEEFEKELLLLIGEAS